MSLVTYFRPLRETGAFLGLNWSLASVSDGYGSERFSKFIHGFFHFSGAANDRFFHADTVACAAGAVIGNRVGRLP